MKSLVVLIGYFFFCTACAVSQEKAIGSCQGCEAIFEYQEEGLQLTNVDTLPDFNEEGPKLKVSGTVYKYGGEEPAGDVILYIYHTNQEGVYPTRGDEKGWARRHGYIRGWVITESDGRYTFYTLKPGTYPTRSEPSHIHPIVLEPDGKYYWIEAYHFDDDPLLAEKERNPENPRGGSSGVLKLQKEGKLWVGTRDIVLGENIEGYE